MRRQLIVMRDHSRKTFRMAFDASAGGVRNRRFGGEDETAALRVRHAELFKVFNAWRHRTRTLRAQRERGRSREQVASPRVALRVEQVEFLRTCRCRTFGGEAALATYRTQSRNRMRRAFGTWQTRWRRSALVHAKQRARVRFATLNHFFLVDTFTGDEGGHDPWSENV